MRIIKQRCRIHSDVMVGNSGLCWKCKNEITLQRKLKKLEKKQLNGKITLHGAKNARLMIYKDDNKRKKTKYEAHFESILKQITTKYTFQRMVIPKDENHGGYILDFYIHKPYKLCIEIDGESHLNRIEKDMYRDRWLLENRGISTVRIKNEDVFKLNVESLKSLLSDYEN